MKDMDKYVEEKARALHEMSEHTDREHGFMYAISIATAETFIHNLAKEIEDKYWASEQYHLDTIKKLKKQLDERGSKVSREWIQDLLYLCDDVSNGEMPIKDLYERLIEAGFEVEK